MALETSLLIVKPDLGKFQKEFVPIPFPGPVPVPVPVPDEEGE